MIIITTASNLFSALSKCSDERLKPFNGMCYLFASYPELNWNTARKVCSSMNAELTSVNTVEEQRYYNLFKYLHKPYVFDFWSQCFRILVPFFLNISNFDTKLYLSIFPFFICVHFFEFFGPDSFLPKRNSLVRFCFN